MKLFALTLGSLLMSSALWGQAMLDRAAVAAGGSIGVAAGKKVSDGMNSVFGKIDGQTKAAAKADAIKKDDPDEQTLKVGTATVVGAASARSENKDARLPAALLPKSSGRRASSQTASAAPAPFIGPTLEPVAPAEPVAVTPPPAPVPPPVLEIVATRELLSAVAVGTPRQEVLARLGVPSSRITMFDDGEAVEILRFQTKSASLGSVRIVNGAVSEVMVVE